MHLQCPIEKLILYKKIIGLKYYLSFQFMRCLLLFCFLDYKFPLTFTIAHLKTNHSPPLHPSFSLFLCTTHATLYIAAWLLSPNNNSACSFLPFFLWALFILFPAKTRWGLLITSTPTFALSTDQEANANQCRYSETRTPFLFILSFLLWQSAKGKNVSSSVSPLILGFALFPEQHYRKMSMHFLS